MNDIIGLYQQLRQNPMALLSRRFNIPQNVNVNNPSDIIQYLLNSGQIQQAQVNQLMGMRNNPIVQQLMNKRF